MSADYVKRATVEVATDASMAHALDKVDGEARQKVIDLILPALVQFPGVTEAAATAAAEAVADAIEQRFLVQTVGTAGGDRQDRFPETGAHGWNGDTRFVDAELKTTLPPEHTIRALQKVGFPVVGSVPHIPGVGKMFRAADGRRSAVELADYHDAVTGMIPRSVEGQVADMTAVRYVPGMTWEKVAAMVPVGVTVLYMQPDGKPPLLIGGEKS